jgi:hypothetical protein
MPNRMGKAKEKTIMCIIFISAPIRSSHSEAKAVTGENKGNIIQGMAVTLPEFVGPDNKV